jgi:hypothetical protein
MNNNARVTFNLVRIGEIVMNPMGVESQGGVTEEHYFIR